MVLVKEFLPNPIGKDAAGEYVALFNDGDTGVRLSGWKLKDASGKIFSLSGYAIESKKDLKLFSTVTKLSLNNSGETISLLDVSGKTVHTLSYSGTAQEGRVIYSDREVTPELRAELFDPLAASVIDVRQNISMEVVATGLLSALLLAVVAALILNKVHAQNDTQETTNAGWPA